MENNRSDNNNSTSTSDDASGRARDEDGQFTSGSNQSSDDRSDGNAEERERDARWSVHVGQQRRAAAAAAARNNRRRASRVATMPTNRATRTVNSSARTTAAARAKLVL